MKSDRCCGTEGGWLAISMHACMHGRSYLPSRFILRSYRLTNLVFVMLSRTLGKLSLVPSLKLGIPCNLPKISPPSKISPPPSSTKSYCRGSFTLENKPTHTRVLHNEIFCVCVGFEKSLVNYINVSRKSQSVGWLSRDCYFVLALSTLDTSNLMKPFSIGYV